MKVCFVGAGSIGKRHIRNLTKIADEDGIDLGIHLLRSGKRPLESEIDGMVEKQFYSFGEVEDDYDAIFLTNPTNLHYEYLLKLNDKARFFFIEKPVFDDINADISVFDGDDHDKYYVACPLRYTNVLQSVRKIIGSDERILSVRAVSSSYLPAWRPGTDYRNTYSAHKDQGGGVRIDLIHEWDYLLDMFGRPERIMQISGKYSDLEIDSEDLAVYIAEYKDKIIELHLDYLGKYTQRYCELITSEHDYIFDIFKSRILRDGEILQEFKEEPNDKYIREMRCFLDIMTGRTENRNNLVHALYTLEIALAQK